jgi:hypothetical protein
MAEEMRIRVSFEETPPAEVAAILSEAGAEEVKQVPQRGLTGIEFLVVGLIASGALANLVSKLARLLKRGVIVDVRGATIVTQENSALPRGSVVIISGNDQKVTLDNPSDAEIGASLKQLLPGGKS